MRTVLHVLCHPEDALAREMIAAQQQTGECEVKVADLNQPSPDYAGLVEKIFEADSVEVW